MKRLLISVALILLSLNINAAISQSGITNLKQLNGNQITELISGNTLTGYISDGQFQGEIVVIYGANGSLAMLFVPDDKLFYGTWQVQNNKNCTKGINVSNFTCYYWFTGIKDGGKNAYVKRNGQIIFQFHKVESANNQKAEDTRDEVAAAIVKKKKVADAQKKRNAEIVESMKKEAEEAEAAGYSSYSEMQAEEKRKKEQERNRKKEQERKKKIEEKKKLENQARINSKNNPGFRDLKPGMLLEDYYKNCVPLYVSPNKCYGIQNIKFSRDIKKIDGVEIITTLYLDMGPISGEDDGSSNLYLDMVKNFNAKYSPDYSFSERDKEVFNAAQKKELLAVYSNGQVVLKISRKTGENTFLEKLWLDIEYRDVENGKRFLEKNKPVKASINDF